MPGVLAALGIAVVGRWLAGLASGALAGLAGLDPSGRDAQSLVSGISMAVVLGLLVRNTAGSPPILRGGLAWMARTGLRIGIVLLGLKLALTTAGRVSAVAIPVAVLCIASALWLVSWAGRRAGLPPRLTALIAVGTSVCGVSAIVATGPAIGADEDETSYAVACITLFGLLALFTHPWLAHAAFGGSPVLAGVFLGTSIHDTSQVAGASLVYQETFDAPLALQAATVTKLLRNTSMALLIPLVAVRFRVTGRAMTAADVRAAIPGFVVWFLAAILLRAAGDVVVAVDAVAGLAGAWRAVLDLASSVSSWALAAALAAVGMNTEIARLRRLGAKPIAVGLIAAMCVGAVSYGTLRTLAAAGYVERTRAERTEIR